MENCYRGNSFKRKKNRKGKKKKIMNYMESDVHFMRNMELIISNNAINLHLYSTFFIPYTFKSALYINQLACMCSTKIVK